MTPYDIEGLFIEKLTQKYKLNERDIKRAFSQYDKDGNMFQICLVFNINHNAIVYQVMAFWT